MLQTISFEPGTDKHLLDLYSETVSAASGLAADAVVHVVAGIDELHGKLKAEMIGVYVQPGVLRNGYKTELTVMPGESQ